MPLQNSNYSLGVLSAPGPTYRAGGGGGGRSSSARPLHDEGVRCSAVRRRGGPVTRILLPLLALVVGLSTATPAWASSPRDELRNRVEKLLAIAEDRSLTVEERAVHARGVVATMFDFSTTARRAFGSNWRRLSTT